MTDPRIEAAARAIGEYVYERNGTPLKWVDMGESRQEVARCYARVALAAADAEDWMDTAAPPDAGILVHIASSAETGSEQAIALWDYDIGCWRNPDMGMLYAPAYFTHWQPLPTSPNATRQAAPDTITIPEVRNDRPIPGKEGADG